MWCTWDFTTFFKTTWSAQYTYENCMFRYYMYIFFWYKWIFEHQNVYLFIFFLFNYISIQKKFVQRGKWAKYYIDVTPAGFPPKPTDHVGDRLGVFGLIPGWSDNCFNIREWKRYIVISHIAPTWPADLVDVLSIFSKHLIQLMCLKLTQSKTV